MDHRRLWVCQWNCIKKLGLKVFVTSDRHSHLFYYSQSLEKYFWYFLLCAASFCSTSCGTRSDFSTHFSCVLAYSVLMVRGWAIFITPDSYCLFVNGNFCKVPAKTTWVSEEWKVLFELPMKNTCKEWRILFKETLRYFSDKYFMGGVGVTSPIARWELKKSNAVALIPKPHIIQGGIQQQS